MGGPEAVNHAEAAADEAEAAGAPAGRAEEDPLGAEAPVISAQGDSDEDAVAEKAEAAPAADVEAAAAVADAPCA